MKKKGLLKKYEEMFDKIKYLIELKNNSSDNYGNEDLKSKIGSNDLPLPDHNY